MPSSQSIFVVGQAPAVRALFLRVRAKRGNQTAYVAVARKMLTVIWHLLVNGETYVEDSFEKNFRSRKVAHGGHVPLEEMAEVLRCAGYIVSGPSG